MVYFIATTIFFSINLAVYVSLKSYYQTGVDEVFIMPKFVRQLIQYSPAAFLQIAIVLNINMWIRFYYKIDMMAGSKGLKVVRDEL